MTVSVAYEDRDAFAARAHLHQELRERGGESQGAARAQPRQHREPDAVPARALLPARADGSNRAGRRPRANGGGRRARSGRADRWRDRSPARGRSGAGRDRGGAQVARPSRPPVRRACWRASASRSPWRPACPPHRTAVGRGLVALLRGALTSRRAEDVLAFVRTPGVAEPNDADWLERAIRRRGLQTAAEALEAWRGRPLFEFEELDPLPPSRRALRVVASLARRIGERPHERQAPLAVREAAPRAARRRHCGRGPRGPRRDARHRGTHPRGARDPGGPRGAAVARANGRTRSSDQPLPDSRPARRPTCSSPRCRKASSHVTTRASRSSPTSSEASWDWRRGPRRTTRSAICSTSASRARRAASTSAGEAATTKERKPRARRSWTTSAICSPRRNPPTGTPILSTGWCSGAGSATWCFPLTRRPASTSWRARSPPQGHGVTTGAAAPELGLDADDARRLSARLETAAARVRRKRLEPGPLSVPAVLDELRARKLFGASTLEGYALCSYRWFVQHELNPQTLEPEPEARAQGSVIHAVLEELYRDPPGGAPLPRPETLAASGAAAPASWSAPTPTSTALAATTLAAVTSRARMVALIDGFLEREAAIDTPFEPDPELLEASFGEDEDDDRPPLRARRASAFTARSIASTFRRPASPPGLIRDYKVSRTVTAGAKLAKEGKLQPQLYALALERAVEAAAARRPLPAPGGHGQTTGPAGSPSPTRPTGLLAGLRPVQQRPARRRAISTTPSGRRGRARRADRRSDAQRGDHRAIRSTTRCPSFCTFQGDLPSGAIGHVRSRRRRGRGRGRVTAEQLELTAPEREPSPPLEPAARRPPRRPSSGARSRPATATSCWRRARAPARLGCWWSATARPPRRQEAGVDSILAFTFTERAAGGAAAPNPRRALAPGVGSTPRRATASARHACADLARDTERAWISTIHGFCRRLLAAHPVALGLDPRFRVLDAGGGRPGRAAAFDEALEELLGEADSERADAGRRDAGAGPSPPRAARHTTSFEARDASRSSPRPADSDPTDAIEDLAVAARAACEETQGGRGGSRNLDRLAAAAGLDPAQRLPTEPELAELSSSRRSKAFKGQACVAYRTAWQRARSALAERDAVAHYRHIAELLGLFARRYAELKEERSGLDFEDLQLEARRLLAEHPAVAETYRTRFRHLMVDEFQDTNRLQLELVRLLRGPRDERVLRRRRVPVDLRLPARGRRGLPA